MLKEIAIFIGIFIISIAIYLFYSPSKSGLASFPTNIGFGIVIGFIGFFIAVMFLTFPFGGKRIGEEISPLEEIDGLLGHVGNLYSEIRLRLRWLPESEKRKPYEEAFTQIKNLGYHLSQARERISIGRFYDAISLLGQAGVIIEGNPYIAPLKTNIDIFREKLRGMYDRNFLEKRS